MEDEDFDESSPEEYEQLLPVIKKTIASRADLQLSGEIKYKFTKKPGKIIEVQCTTSDGKVVCVEMEDNREVRQHNFIFLTISKLKCSSTACRTERASR